MVIRDSFFRQHLLIALKSVGHILMSVALGKVTGQFHDDLP